VAKGSTVEFRALRAPENAPAWPADYPHWGGSSGASGNGPETVVTFNAASASPDAPKMVMANCGNTVSLAVVVVDLAALTVNANRTSPPVESSFPILEGEHFEVGGTFRYDLALGPWPDPIAMRFEWWSLDWVNERLATGPGASFTQALQAGLAEGRAKVTFFSDLNGDYANENEPQRDSDEFVVKQNMTRMVSFTRSTTTLAFANANADNLLTAAGNLIRVKHCPIDYRASVVFQRSGNVGSWTPGPDSPPGGIATPADWDAVMALSATNRIVDQLDYIPSIGYRPWLVIWQAAATHDEMDQIITLDTHRLSPSVFAHEYGHNVGLLHKHQTSLWLMFEYDGPRQYIDDDDRDHFE